MACTVERLSINKPVCMRTHTHAYTCTLMHTHTVSQVGPDKQKHEAEGG